MCFYTIAGFSHTGRCIISLYIMETMDIQHAPGSILTEQIFISYSKKDSDFGHKLADDLEVVGG